MMERLKGLNEMATIMKTLLLQQSQTITTGRNTEKKGGSNRIKRSTGPKDQWDQIEMAAI